MTLAHDHDLRIGEHHAQRRAARETADFGVVHGVVARDVAFIGRFVEQRQFRHGITGDEDVGLATTPAELVVEGYSPLIQFQAGVLETEIVDVRAAPRGYEAVFEG